MHPTKNTEIFPDFQDDSWNDRAVSCYLLVYSIDSHSSFVHVASVVEGLRQNRQTAKKPILLASNKIDLERKRAIKKDGGWNATLTGFAENRKHD